MTFRLEQKISMTKLNSFLLFKKLNNNGLKEIYKKRIIKSIYFDNVNLSMFIDSEEGIRPRYKIRIREYPDFSNEYFLEKKISSEEGRFKTTDKITLSKKNQFEKNGYFSKKYGVCKPNIIVIYQRSYYTLKNVRITFDENIKYQDYKHNNNFFREKNNVFEIKADSNGNIEEIENLIGSKNRFSKYSRGIIFLFNQTI